LLLSDTHGLFTFQAHHLVILCERVSPI